MGKTVQRKVQGTDDLRLIAHGILRQDFARFRVDPIGQQA